MRCGIGPSLAFAVTLGLVGCGGDGGESSTGQSSETQLATVSAQNATYSTGYSELFEVDLSSKVFSSTGGGFALSEVKVLSNDNSCQVESMTETGFVIQASDPKVCDYRYHVTPRTLSPMGRVAEAPMAMSDNSSGEDSNSAIARIAVSSDPSSTELVPVSATTLINEDVSISLKSELDKVGFTLGDEFVLTEPTLPYARSSSVKINDTDDQVLEYTPPQGFTGIDRVLYTFEDSENSLVLMGVLDIAVGYEANQGFTINDTIEYPDAVNVFTEIEIDISEFVTSDDGDDYQLVYVNTFNAEAASKDPLNTGNKKIVFQASKPGYHYISFAVSDHNGVYDMGLIRVEVVDPNQSGKWEGIPYLADVFTAPLTAADAANKGLAYDAKLSDTAYSPAIDMAGVRYPTAVEYCQQSGASLPTVEELSLMATNINVQTLHNWPAEYAYLAYDDVAEEAKWVDLSDSGSVQTGALSPTGYYYATCIKQGLVQVQPDSSTEVVANGTDVGTVSVELKLGDEVRPDTQISASVSGAYATLYPETQTTDSQGIAEFTLTSTKAETVTVTFDVGGVTLTHEVKFIGDEKTAGVTSEATINNASYTSVEGNEVTATLKDAYENPVEGYSVESKVSTGVHPDTSDIVTPLLVDETTETDAQGEQKVRVKWDPQYQTPKINMTFDVTSSYTTTVGEQTESTSQVTFNAYLCGGQVGDDDRTNAVGDCIKIAENDGMLYTGSPSVSFLKELEYDEYGNPFYESGAQGPPGAFARFTPSEARQLCEHYNTIALNGKNDWRLATRKELLSLFRNNSYSPMFHVKGWATGWWYWSSTPAGGSYYNIVSLYNGRDGSSSINRYYASCVSGS
ncbi:Ig-like domain-containing protein [Vibrio chagasii]|uniref:Ig-like domain-containing protein n=1 Tax=Vibrio chagasii TaxID=170679 RepID=UPI001640C086|nr:Ig-like domain-containing protein [Vibrio chagasii]